MNLNSFAKRLFAAWMAIFFLASPLVSARIAYAQNSTVADLPRILEWIKNGIVDFVENTMQAAIVTTLINTMSFAADRLAYDAAVRIATGGAAEEPLYDGTPERTYLGQFAADMAGEAIGSLSETIEGAGGLLSNFDLCAPSTPYIMLQFKLGIKGVFDRPTPKCDFNKMFGPEGTWVSFIADLTAEDPEERTQVVLYELANMYDPQKAEFGAGLGLYTDIFGENVFIPLLQTEKKLEDGGFKDVVDFITGNVETPADMLREQVKEAQKESGDVRQQATFAMLGNKDLLLQIGVHAGSVFTNTLVSKIQEQIWLGLFDFEQTQVDPFDPDSFVLNTTEDAAEHYRSLLTAAPLQISNYSILSEFITCPGSDARGLYNCVADSNFVSAIAREEAGAPMTITEAVEEGLLDSSWPLIPSADVARNQDAFCYTYGFCYGNLVKLRKARVISIGWELAANSSANSIEDPVTLQEVLDGFNSCGADGLPDDNHPWCKMIDPDWVLKYPDTQCRMQAYGEVLLTNQADERGQVCVDMPSCITEDEDGNCVGGYGYCVAEENTWRFRGESCPEYAASCLVFEDSEGASMAYLRNTVDPGPCTEDTVGCRWYATEKEEQEDGSYEFAAVTSIADTDAESDTYASRIYFNSQVEECDEEEGGCATLIERGSDLRLNAIYNPSFEIDNDTDEWPDGWYDYHLLGFSWPSESSSDGTYSRESDWAMSPGEASSGYGALYQPGIELGQARTYTLSFYARQLADGDADSITATLDLKDETGTEIDISGLAISGDCNDSYTDILGSTVTTGVGIEDVVPADSSYERFSCTFTVPPLSDSSLRVFGDLYFYNFDGYIDSVQLEQGEDVSVPVIGYSESDYTTVVAKVAPAYLGCTGEESDPEACADYAQVCAEQDMGCTLYTPTNGDPDISGIATELDECPEECAGYDTYRQEATSYEPEGVDAVYFIPDTATECSAEEVGCDEFTNLATEEQEYYTFLRACVTEDQAAANISSDNEATFYTWEGSDEDGYQLRTWTLLESNAGSSSYTHIDNDDGTGGATDTAPDQAPCSEWTAGEDGISCNDTADEDGDGVYDWDTEDCNERADIYTNSDCREFYDENGNIHYREWQRGVTVNDACQSYRKTEIAGDDATEWEATCEDSGGYYVTDSGECRYYGYDEESESCEESANGCRAYAGGRSRNSRLVLEDVFEEGTLNNWDAPSASYATYSNESLAADGHSMLITSSVTTFTADNGSACSTEDGCAGAAVSFGGECTIGEEETYCGTLHDELYAGKTYTVSIVAKGSGTVQVGFDVEADPTAPTIDIAFDDAVDLDDGWQLLTFGPLIMDEEDYPLFGDGTTLVITPSDTAYIDNVVLREGEEDLNIIRDSWVTPASCDESITGDASPQYYLGCQEYNDQDGETAYVKSLSSLCDEDKVGCDAFFKTQESESVTAETRNATCENVDADSDGEPDTATSATACYYFLSSTVAFDEGSPYLCTISVGEDSCLFSQDGFTPLWVLPAHLSYGPETVITPADADMFLVVTSDVTCDDDVAGCTELGEPEWSQDRNSTTGAESVYLLNLPDTYDDILCTHEELFCDAFTTNEAETLYFKHPLEQTCEYRTDVTVDGTAYTGWFRSDTDDFCYGTCEDSVGTEGDACGSDADCTSSETCNTGNPSYVIGGTESGIWNNGDDDYRAWVGECSATYDTCTEFQDKLAQDDGELYGETDGTSYFYLNNDSLSDYGLSDSQKCDGQVSLKNGCAMFYDTGDTSMSANASATDTASRHADVLFGSEPYGLVDPIDCENGGDTTITTADGEEIDLCATRCAYDYGEVYDLTDGATYQEKLDLERSSSVDYTQDEMYIFGTSCYQVDDCAQIQGESGTMVDALTCATQVRVDPFSVSSSFGGSFGSWSSRSSSTGYEEVPRLENDTNSVLKVNRDRSCAEWLSCSDATTQWDESTASFVTTCNDIALCKGYDASTGGTFCSDWDFTKPEVIYDAEWYASRDTSWYGNDYSGMTIPNLFPVQSLTQANVGPVGYCVTGEEGDYELYGAVSDSSCDTLDDACGTDDAGTCVTPDDAFDGGALDEMDYALVLNAGECTEDYGEACAVGYCEDTGAACATSDQCSSGSCIVGACYDLDEDTDDADGDGDTSETVLCQDVSDCDEGQTCYGGACADVGDDVAIEYYDADAGTASTCASSETFVGDATLKLGSCINEACLLTPDGETYENGVTEGKICRAYPENNSPFPTSVVDEWYDPSDAGSIDDAPDEESLPYDMISGFENVLTCGYGEDCDCSYTKVTYGEGAETRYYDMDWETEFSICGGDLDSEADAGQICTANSDCESNSCIDVTDQLGVCQSGDRIGGYCTEDEQCGDGNTCAKSTRQDILYGMNGFCLENDTSTNILGDRNEQACISWLPVDRLAGDTDLRAKYTEAGFFEEVNYCTYLDTYASVNTAWGCLEMDHSETDVYEECMNENTACPAGFAMVAGPYEGADKGDGETAEETDENGQCLSGSGADGDNDCPFMCVPLNSVTNSGEDCIEWIEENFDDSPSNINSPAGGGDFYNLDRYWNNDEGEYSEAFSTLSGCSTYGVQYSELEAVATDGTNSVGNSFMQNSWGGMPEDHATGEECGTGGECGWYNYNGAERFTPYFACKEVTQVATGDFEDDSAPWTDVLLNADRESDSLTAMGLISSDYEAFGYLRSSANPPFGAAQAINDMESENGGDASPSYVNQCRQSDGDGESWYLYNATGTPSEAGGSGLECASGQSEVGSDDGGVNNPEAGTFTYFDGYKFYQDGTTFEEQPSDFLNVGTDGVGPAEILNRVFARAFDIFTFVDGVYDEDGLPRDEVTDGWVEEADEGAYSSEAPWDDRAEYGNPPTIWSVDTTSCTDDGTMCEEGIEGRITVNSDDTGDQSGNEYFSAIMKFYAAADKNQLPIRRIIVDWGDDRKGGAFSGSEADDNFYKNSRGLQEGTQASKCELYTEWGLTDDSCDPYYYSFNHIYTCSSEVLSDVTADCDGDGSTGDSDGDFPCRIDLSGDSVADSCVFKPRVFVRDNWGWCTGTCTDGNLADEDGRAGCYAGNDNDIGTLADYAYSECSYEIYPDQNDDISPWVEYNGTITVTP